MKKGIKKVQIAAYALSAVAAVLCIAGLFASSQAAWKVNSIIELAVITIAFIYFYKGCKKDYNKYYKYVMILMLIEYLASYLEGAFISDYVVVTEWWQDMLSVMVYGSITLLAFAKDLGKKASLILTGFNSVVYILYVLCSIGSDTGNLIMSLEWLVVSVICFLMVIGKYKDKENRTSSIAKHVK